MSLECYSVPQAKKCSKNDGNCQNGNLDKASPGQIWGNLNIKTSNNINRLFTHQIKQGSMSPD